MQNNHVYLNYSVVLATSPYATMHIHFCALKNTDLELLYSWFMKPHVAYWWPEPQDDTAFTEKWHTRIQHSISAYHTPWHGHLIRADDVPMGYIQYYHVPQHHFFEYPELPKHTIGIDLFIGNPEYLGKKLGVMIIRTYLETIIAPQEAQTSTIMIDPAITNTRAIHVYTKAGFKPLNTYKKNQKTFLLMYKKL